MRTLNPCASRASVALSPPPAGVGALLVGTLLGAALAGCTPSSPDVLGNDRPRVDTGDGTDSGADSAGDTAADDTAGGDSGETDTGDGETGESAPLCVPGGDDVYGVEGEALQVSLRCTGTGSATAFLVVNLPDGAVWDAASATLSWTPGLDQANRWDVQVQVADHPEDVGWVTLWVADAWAHRGNVPVDPTAYPEEYGLPVLHLTRPGNTGSDVEVPSTMVFRGQPYDIGLKYRGASSLYYPKNSYTLSFSPDHEFEDPATGYLPRRQVVLTTLFDDNSYVRQKMCFDVFNALDPTRQQVQTRFVVVYINGAYEGLYMLGDHIDSEWWQDNGYRDGADVNIYKAVDHSANFYTTYGGREKSSLHQGYDKKHGEPSDWTDLDALVSWVSTSSDDDFRAHLDEHLAVDEFMDWWILVRFTEADDSAGKNSYLWDDPLTPRFHFAPWDFNHSFGQTWQTDRESSSTNEDFGGTNNIFNRIMEDEQLSLVMYDRYREDLDTVLAAESLSGWMDGYYAEIDPSARRDWDKWSDAYYSYGGWSWRDNFTDYDGEVAYLRTWVEERVRFMNRLYP